MSETYNIDCIDLMKNYDDKFFDLAVVDPPYGISANKMSMGTNLTRTGDGYKGISTAQKLRLNSGGEKLKNRALNTMNCDWDLAIPSEEYFQELFRVSKNQIIWGGNYFKLPPTRGIIAWNKNQPWDNFSQFELAWTSFDCPAKLFTYSNRGGANLETKIHPTQKPIFLYDYCFKNFAKEGMKILDTHLGSGSSRIAAQKQNLNFVGCEIDKSYFDAQEKRFKDFNSQVLLF